MMRAGTTWLVAALFPLAFVASLVFGEVSLPIASVFDALRGQGEPVVVTIVRDFRLPRSLVGAAVGAALAASGVVMQALFRNSLASPGLLGVSSGAALGAVSVIAAGVGHALWSVPLAAIGGAFLSTAAVMVLARKGAGTERLLLSGIALNALLDAGTAFLLSTTAGRLELSGQILFWLMGGLESRTAEHVAIGIPSILAACALLLPLGRALDLISVGEQSAQSLGVDVRRVRGKLIVLSTLLTAFATSVAGVIGFIGLVVPHLLRVALGPDHRRLLPVSMMGGAALTLFCDVATRVLPGGLRLGVVTAVVGGPLFLWMLRTLP
jgi:iron complex transport system permease protein